MRFLLNLFIALAGLAFYGQDSPYPALLLPEALKENANSIVRNQEIRVNLLSQRDMRISKTRVVTVLDKQGNNSVDAFLPYNDAIKIYKMQARVYDLFGNEVARFREKDFRDVSAVDGGTLYSDSRVKYLEFTPVQYPYTVEFHYEISTANTGLVPSWYLQNNSGESIEKSTYTLNYASPELRPESREFNMEAVNVERKEANNEIYFSVSSLPAMSVESLSPSFRKLVPHIKLRMLNFHYEGVDAEVQDWQTLGHWINQNLLNGQDELPETTRAYVRNLVRDMDAPLDKARAIYEYVQKNTRYISVQIGIGGIKPISAMEVDKVKYGDCKGLANYTMALMEAVGVTAYYCHVEAGREKIDFLEGFADLGQGNHVILAVEDGEKLHWIDCTSSTLPFGFLGDFTDDRTTLMVTPEGGKLVRTPAYLNEMNYQRTESEMEVLADGGITSRLQINSRGIQYDNHAVIAMKPREDLSGYYRDYWPYINNLQIEDCTLENNKDSIEFTERLKIKAASYASVSGNLMLITPNAFNRSGYVPDRYRQRKMPFEVSRGFLDEDEFTIKLPAGYRLESMKKETRFSSVFGDYEVAMEYDPDLHQVTYRRKLQINAGEYPSNQYGDYREFRKSVAAADNSQIVLIEDPAINK